MVCSSKSESTQTKNIRLQTQGGVASHPIHPPGSATVAMHTLHGDTYARPLIFHILYGVANLQIASMWRINYNPLSIATYKSVAHLSLLQ